MEELEVRSEYMLGVSKIYKKVICCLCMVDEISDLLNNTIDVKQEC